MIKSIINWFNRECKHDSNYNVTTWKDESGTPMVTKNCVCGYLDEGHVHSGDDYQCKQIIVRGGEIVYEGKSYDRTN